MPEKRTCVIGGVDCHSRTHHAVALDDRGQRLGDAEFPATLAGYQALHSWLEGFGAIEALGIASTSSYGAGLTRWLASHKIRVLEVNQPHKHTRSCKGSPTPSTPRLRRVRSWPGRSSPFPRTPLGRSSRSVSSV
jgi:transposase